MRSASAVFGLLSALAVPSHALCISCLQQCCLHQPSPPLAVECILIWCGTYPSNKTLAQSSFTQYCWINYCMCHILLTCTCTEHYDSYCFYPCNPMSERIITLLTRVLCGLCLCSVNKHFFFLVSASGHILLYICNIKSPPVLSSV
jgi:hypothetical protein